MPREQIADMLLRLQASLTTLDDGSFKQAIQISPGIAAHRVVPSCGGCGWDKDQGERPLRAVRLSSPQTKLGRRQALACTETSTSINT